MGTETLLICGLLASYPGIGLALAIVVMNNPTHPVPGNSIPAAINGDATPIKPIGGTPSSAIVIGTVYSLVARLRDQIAVQADPSSKLVVSHKRTT